ncbi:hypothetical protein jhhlp_004670 [Lomentospora prolificans]|uniref:Nucleolar 27S pre-rRNA processing Urb2/Npa2 C-terminal domain-containing protein n=1 Tax=Lomentospora prolificans TaxID=41688 RepID=A0A2N3NC84_9PEZI|nr:hypothetical protein jhhlp_004670 [Lomentospora prolificans]
MSSDSEMPDAPAGVENDFVDGHALIKAVRTLDKEGPGEGAENLVELWKALSRNASGQFYAAEQSSLRWLLKMMNPSTKSSTDSETLRRYPLTWNILNCVFQRIPLFSLAKALADRRFITVLRQAVKDLSTPSGEEDTVPSLDRKRKRSQPAIFDVEVLRKPSGCLRSADALFEALHSLISRLAQAAEASTRETVGAEHVKSLFALPAAESLELVAPMLAICYNSLEVLDSDFEINVSWVKVASDIWDLRLRSGTDVLEVATRTAQTTLTMFSNLDECVGRISGKQAKYSHFPAHIRRSWTTDLKDFLQRNLFLPARTAYINSTDLEPLNMAVLMTQNYSTVTAPAIFLLAQNSPKPFDEKSKEKIPDWINEVVKAIDGSLRHVTPDIRSRVVEGILDEARSNGTRISEEVLRDICSKYGFEDGAVRWSILSASLRLDPDILFDHDQANALLDGIVENLPSLDDLREDDSQHVIHILNAIIKAFTNAKEFPAFLKLWYGQLSKVGADASSSSAPWLQHSVRYNESIFSQSKLELTITVNQLLDILAWLECQRHGNPAPLLVIVDSIAHGIGSPEFTDVVGTKISSIVLGTFSPQVSSSAVSSLRWSILNRSVAWLAPQERDDLWKQVKGAISEELQRSRLSDQHTLEAFKFIFTTWSLMTPDGDHQEEVSSIAKGAVDRLTKEIPAKAGKKTLHNWTLQHTTKYTPSNSQDANPEAYLAWYLDYTLGGSSRFLPLLSHASTESPFPEYTDAVLKLLLSKDKKQKSKAESDEVTTPAYATRELFRALLSNENLLNSRPFVDQLVNRIAMTVRGKFKKAEDEILDPSLSSLFLEVPDECFTRSQREILATVILERITAFESKKNISPSQWQLVLAILTKLMKRPTFCEGLDFNFLVALAEQVSRSFESDTGPRGLSETRGLSPLYQELAVHVITLMANDFDNRGKLFFEEAASYVKECPVDDKSTQQSRLRLHLFKALVMVLSGSSYLTGSSSPLTPEEVKKKLAEAISATLKKYARYLRKQSGEMETGSYIYTMLAALDCSDVIQAAQLDSKSFSVGELVKASMRGIKSRRLYGWKLRAFLLRHYPDSVDKTLVPAPAEPSTQEEAPKVLDRLDDEDLPPLVLECTKVALQSLRQDSDRLLYLKDLIAKLEFKADAETQLTAIRCVVQTLAGKFNSKISAGVAFAHTSAIGLPPSSNFKDYDLAAAYTMLAQKSIQANSGVRFGKVCEILHIIFDANMGHVAQWNVEETLSLVSVVCGNNGSNVKDSDKTFQHLCKLVEVILKKYRLRLEGHFHLLITAMQALLKALLLHPYDASSKAWANPPLDTSSGVSASYPVWEDDAAAYNRLLTLICEPTVGSVTRSHHGGALDAAADVAKRSAGRQMYLVLMAYVRLQMEVGVPRSVRESLEPGVNTIFDVTPGEVRKVMNDGLDKAGREILGDLYKRYRMFGKWTGK